jgi:hypothetical protein
MRVFLPDLDISIFVVLSDVTYVSKAVVHVKCHLINLLLAGRVDLYSSIFRPLTAFDCGGRTIGEDWVRHVSYQTYRTYNYPFINKLKVIQDLNSAYQNELQLREPLLSNIIPTLQRELISHKRIYFKPGDLLMYTTTVSHEMNTKKYLMHVIIE